MEPGPAPWRERMNELAGIEIDRVREGSSDQASADRTNGHALDHRAEPGLTGILPTRFGDRARELLGRLAMGALRPQRSARYPRERRLVAQIDLRR